MEIKNLDDREEIIRKFRELIDGGLSIEDVIKHLHEKGMTITESMKALMVVYDMSLRDAKSLVSAHPVWKDIVAASEPLQLEAEQEIREQEKQQNS